MMLQADLPKANRTTIVSHFKPMLPDLAAVLDYDRTMTRDVLASILAEDSNNSMAVIRVVNQKTGMYRRSAWPSPP